MLEVDDIVVRYGETEAVAGVSFRVGAGEIYGLLGPNGAGKTSTIAVVSGLLRPAAGAVKVDGVSLAADTAKAQRAMGVVPQEVALYEELSGRENLVFWGRLAGLSKHDARFRAAALLEELELVDRGGDPVKAYSGGMKRRINIGCALMHRPRLLLLDEPTVGIDPQARMKLLEFVRGLAGEGTAVLYTTHYLDEAETLCRRIGVIDHGKLLAEGTLAELQGRLGQGRLFLLEGDFAGADPDAWPGFRQDFRLIQGADQSLLVAAAAADRDPAECLRQLLDLPVPVENVTVKKPNLNDLFLQLTGRGLRE